ncbi:MAG: amidohydrolase [Actinomycetia bacterium]|nr:amidohydrolase [Actinomycetes bacterium]
MADDTLVRWRRDLHRIPELGHQEYQTADYLERVLRDELGLVPRRLTATGLVADIDGRGGAGPTLVVRADMDGLPLAEESGEPFASEHPGVMHACGHDAHMAIALGLGARLVRDPGFPGRVRLLFQPSEEVVPGGALDMIAAGALEDAAGVLGLHVWAEMPVGVAGLAAGPVTANADRFQIIVQGRGGHGSEPQRTQDAALIAAETVVALQSIVSRRLDPQEPAVVTVGIIRAGSAFNIIADRAELYGTVRTFSPEARRLVEAAIGQIAEHTAAMHGAQAEYTYWPGYPAVVNHPAVVRHWREALEGVVTVVDIRPTMVGEDYAYYLQHRPGAFLYLGARPEGGDPAPHHSPRFRLHEAALPLGVAVLERGVRVFLARPELLRGPAGG